MGSFPMQKERVVVVRYWDCGYGHEHLSFENAKKCIGLANSDGLARERESLSRKIKVSIRVLEGETYAEVGRSIDRSGARVREMLMSATRLADKERKYERKLKTLRANKSDLIDLLYSCEARKWGGVFNKHKAEKLIEILETIK